MRNQCENTLFNWIIKALTLILNLCFLSALLGIIAIIYNRYPSLYTRLLNLWPIGLLILSIFFQYIFFETKFSIFLPLSGFSFIIGLMFNLNLHIKYYTDAHGLPIILISLAASILNYYIFKRRTIFLLPFILLLTITSILILLAPLYTPYINSSSLYLYLIIIVLISTCYTLLKNIP